MGRTPSVHGDKTGAFHADTPAVGDAKSLADGRPENGGLTRTRQKQQGTGLDEVHEEAWSGGHGVQVLQIHGSGQDRSCKTRREVQAVADQGMPEERSEDRRQKRKRQKAKSEERRIGWSDQREQRGGGGIIYKNCDKHSIGPPHFS